jgi:hypothetical protein
MRAAIRPYEGVDRGSHRGADQRVGESLVPRLSEMPGFGVTTSSRPTRAS